MIPVGDADRQGPAGRIKSRQQKRAEIEARRKRFGHAQRAEMRFRRQLKAVARQVGAVVRAFAPGGRIADQTVLTRLNQNLQKYADILQPWAEEVSRQMVEEVAARDAGAWQATGEEIGRGLRKEIEGAYIGQVFKERRDAATRLIQSIPLEAAQRVNALVIEGMSGGRRSEETAEEIRNTEGVTESRAKLIARTETSKASTALTEARARHVGSPGYFWETAEDADVRESHRKMQGKFVRWDEPPTLDGMTGHAGEYPNCRCWPRVALPETV